MPVGLDRCVPLPPANPPKRSDAFRLKEASAVKTPFEMHLVSYRTTQPDGKLVIVPFYYSVKSVERLILEKLPAVHRSLFRAFNIGIGTLTPNYNCIKIIVGNRLVRAIFSWPELLQIGNHLGLELGDLSAAPIVLEKGNLRLANRSFSRPTQETRLAITRFLKRETIGPPTLFVVPCREGVHFCDDAQGEPCYLPLTRTLEPNDDYYVQLTFAPNRSYVMRLFKRGHSSVQVYGVFRGEIEPKLMLRIL